MITWGRKKFGGDCSKVQGQLAAEVKSIYSNDKAFAAVKFDGSVVAWGDAEAQTKLDGVTKSFIKNGQGDATAAVKEVQDKGVLIGAGFIAGESLMGVLLAIFIVAEMDPSSWFGGIGTLSYTLSLVFFGWFVAVFIML